MMKNILTEEITRINNIIHRKKILNESLTGSVIRKAITQSIKSVIDDVIKQSIKTEVLSIGKKELAQIIKTGSIDTIYKSMIKTGSQTLDDIVKKTTKSLSSQGIENIDSNTIKAQIIQELQDEASSNEIKNSLKSSINIAKTELEKLAKQSAENTTKKSRSDWFKSSTKTQLKPEFEFKPTTKPSDLGINPTSEMRSEVKLLETTLTEQSKKTLLDYFKKGGRATYDGIKKLIKIGFLDANGKVNRKRLWIWGTVLGVTGTLYAIGKWCGDNPDTIEDDNLIDDGGSGSSDSSDSTDNKPTDNKPTDNKPTDNKPTDNKPTDNKPTSGGVTYDTEYDLPGYSAVDLDWNKLKM